MKNELFEITFNKESGGITSIKNPNDLFGMNWSEGSYDWGIILNENRVQFNKSQYMELISFKEDEISSQTVYSNGKLQVTVTRYFNELGNLVEVYNIKNVRSVDVFVQKGDFGIITPFNDKYPNAEDCMTKRCNTHIWCGHNTSYVNALRMGVSDINLGLVLKKGALSCYSISRKGIYGGNNRGAFILHPEHLELLAGEEYTICWELFQYKGTADFYSKAKEYENFILVEAEQYTVFEGEKIEFSSKLPRKFNKITVSCDNVNIPFILDGNTVKVEYMQSRLGEHRFWICTDEIKTNIDINVMINFEELLHKRVNRIVDEQQYQRKESPLYGAYLIYDNKEKRLAFDGVISDHNASRERVGMALLIIKYLQKHPNEKIRQSCIKYIEFVNREFYDEATGEVYNTIGKNRDQVRLYNAPWITMLFTELYILINEKKYLMQVSKILRNYYKNGGSRFYPNGLSMYKTVQAFRIAEMTIEAEEALEYYKSHVQNIINIGISYPKHEVNFEQTIVTPAVTYISQIGRLLHDDIYLKEAKKHVEILERFNGQQPSYHLNEIPIRYWDDYWFGKNRMFGDTFPHYWSCLTARSYYDYFKISGDKKYLEAAKKSIRNCLCLFNEEGKGSCAYVYPFSVDEKRGEFYDEWANDQDFALYFAMDMLDLLD